jgi:hypothetical protein
MRDGSKAILPATVVFLRNSRRFRVYSPVMAFAANPIFIIEPLTNDAGTTASPQVTLFSNARQTLG